MLARIQGAPQADAVFREQKMGRPAGAITYRRAIEMLERARLMLIKISAQQEETNAELRLLISELATLLAKDDGRGR